MKFTLLLISFKNDSKRGNNSFINNGPNSSQQRIFLIGEHGSEIENIVSNYG
jgi:hypothetical protein